MTVITCIEDLRRLHQARVPRMFYDYADSGSWTEGTYRANESDFQRIKLRQRVAVNLENRSIAGRMVGVDVAMPVALAPTGLTGMQHADGEILAARAAERFGVPFTLSTMSICSIEDVKAHTRKPFWFQLYVMRDRAFIEVILREPKGIPDSDSDSLPSSESSRLSEVAASDSAPSDSEERRASSSSLISAMSSISMVS